MATNRRGLGRGLGALIPGAGGDEAQGPAREIDLSSISESPFQPRREIEGPEFDELVSSIRRHGILQPIVARPFGGGYQIVAGERRWRAARAAGLVSIPVLVREITDRQALEIALVENLRREDLNPIDRARAYRRLSDEFGMTQEQVAEAVGGSRSSVANTLRLLDLPQEVQHAIDQGRLTEGHGRALLTVPETGRLLEIWQQVEKRNLSVRETEALAKTSGRIVSRETTQRPRSGGDPILLDLALRLQERYATSVAITARGKRGAIEINYYSNDDLERLIDLLLR